LYYRERTLAPITKNSNKKKHKRQKEIARTQAYNRNCRVSINPSMWINCCIRRPIRWHHRLEEIVSKLLIPVIYDAYKNMPKEKAIIEHTNDCTEVLLPVVVPTCMGEERDQKPQLSCSMVAWWLLAHNMPEDIADILNYNTVTIHYTRDQTHLKTCWVNQFERDKINSFIPSNQCFFFYRLSNPGTKHISS